MQTPEEITTFDAPKLAQTLKRILERAIKVGNAALIFVQYENNFDRKEAQSLLSQVLKETQIELVEINRDGTDFFELALNLTNRWGVYGVFMLNPN